jgi:hypothetical protein
LQGKNEFFASRRHGLDATARRRGGVSNRGVPPGVTAAAAARRRSGLGAPPETVGGRRRRPLAGRRASPSGRRVTPLRRAAAEPPPRRCAPSKAAARCHRSSGEVPLIVSARPSSGDEGRRGEHGEPPAPRRKGLNRWHESVDIG